MPNWDILVLDISASMLTNKKDLISGFNNLVSEQKQEQSTNLLTVITFNDVVEIFKEETFPNVSEIKETDITTTGTTALVDAVGEVYDMILNNNVKYENITLTVITDGQENSSKNYTIDELNEKKKHIDNTYMLKMVFIGADFSCITENQVNSHATQSVDCGGNIQKAMRIASRSMSGGREGSQYIPQGLVDAKPITPLIMKRSNCCNSDDPPKVRICRSICEH